MRPLGRLLRSFRRRFLDSPRRSRRTARAVALVCLSLSLGIWPHTARSEAVDLELVLAVDTSVSVSLEEFTLQVAGLAQAFRDPRVHAAIRAAGDRGIAVSLVQWANHNDHWVAIGWTKVEDDESAQRLSDDIAGMPRRFAGYGTAISSALQFCTDLFFGNGFESARRVIDMSGDGSDNRGPIPSGRRDVAVSLGITVNGLAILNEEPNLDFYYLTHVIGGTGAFVMAADDYLDFADAIVIKLIREISQAPMVEAPAPPGARRLADRR